MKFKRECTDPAPRDDQTDLYIPFYDPVSRSTFFILPGDCFAAG